MTKILIVEDERPISDLIKINLEAEGYHCTCAYDGEVAANLLENETFDLALLDIMLPKIDGYELLDYVNTLGIPAIFLTAKATIKDKVLGLRLGAEDYIIKPFDISELLARVEVVLRRYHKNEDILIFHDLVIDCQKKTVHKNNILLNLTPKEFDLLCFFVRNKDMIVYKDTIYESIWETDYDLTSRTLELHIQRLRKKAGLHEALKTLYGSGYRLDS